MVQPQVGAAAVRAGLPEPDAGGVVPADALDDVIAALRDAHPYEEPAYDVYPLLDA